MKARRVNESLKDILVPKSKQQIRKDIKSINDPQQILRFKVKEACEEYWKREGIRFGKINSDSEFSKKYYYCNSKIRENTPFMPEYADVKGTSMGAFNELYGRFVLKSGKLSNTTQSIAYTTVDKR